MRPRITIAAYGQTLQQCHGCSQFPRKPPKSGISKLSGLPSNPYHCLQEVNRLKGFSSLMSFIIKGTYDEAVKFIDSVELLTHATHMGASKSIVTHPASTK